jgi:hypothetical protein
MDKESTNFDHTIDQSIKTKYRKFSEVIARIQQRQGPEEQPTVYDKRNKSSINIR